MGAVILNEGLILLAIGAVGLVDGLRLLRVAAAANEAFGPGWYLILLSIIMLLGGAYYFISTFHKKDTPKEAGRFKPGPAMLAIIAMLVYSFLISYIGYFISTALFLLACMHLFGERSWIKTALISGTSAAAFWILFVYLAELPMP